MQRCQISHAGNVVEGIREKLLCGTRWSQCRQSSRKRDHWLQSIVVYKQK